MNRISIYIVWFFTALILSFSACEGLDDDYSTNPAHRLSFSTDTLSFDTIFSSIGSTTRQFLIYNPNSEALSIENIMLAGAGTTGFRMNVDGRKGDNFKDVGILAKDSMFVFVEVTVDPNGTNQPLLIQDSILFMVNGLRQSVLLEAYGQDVHLYKGGYTISNDTLLRADKPYLIYDSLVVSPDVTVQIEKGATFYLHHKANIITYGSLKALGTLDSPIVFRGDRLDFVLNDRLLYDRTPGQWGSILFKSDSYENEFDHVIVRNGTNGLTFFPATPERSKLKMNNSQITNMTGNLLSAVNCQMEIANTEFTNASGVVVALMSGNYKFAHCTVANFITLKSRNDSIPYSLVLSSSLPENQTGQLYATFDNCIVDGSRIEELLLEETGSDVYYRFNHSVLKYNGEDNAYFNNNRYISKSLSYRKLGGEDNKYEYDFRLAADTIIGVGMADPLITQQYPTDRYGVDRLNSPTGPTIGAYEFVPEEEPEE
ncbi:hypothetical protein LJC57_07490 [Parabacteroides sp. OttesenSCG-928-G07]|nr:hypothetical protein [Parabacteroides sp. OttesenSCG-928-G21]MDL2278419.1 hypothetical protein [Parabacteroides sp. OttesenSCG-928-G07]